MSDVVFSDHPSERGVRRLESSAFIPRPLDEVFAFFSDARNLELLTPPWMNFRIATEGPIEMRVGTIIDYKLRVRLLPLRWRSKITVWDPPHRFVDDQLKGPYLKWIHEHSFEEVEGGTVVRDCVNFRVPGGILIEKLAVRRDLLTVFAYRTQVLAEHFGLN
jgi:ligand-binding SRPBCC domain-containing protein